MVWRRRFLEFSLFIEIAGDLQSCNGINENKRIDGILTGYSNQSERTWFDPCMSPVASNRASSLPEAYW
jgi:hypothetical protein